MTQPNLPGRRHLAIRSIAVLMAVGLVQLDLGLMFSRGRLAIRSAEAQVTARKVALLVVPKAKAQAGEAPAVEQILRGFVGRTPVVQGFDFSPTGQPEVDAKAAATVDEALRALLLRNPRRAEEKAVEAQKLLDGAPGSGDARTWARLFKALGLARLGQGDKDGAKATILRSLVLWPSQRLDEYDAYSAEAKSVVADAREAFNALQTGGMKLSSTPTGSSVFVDGRERSGTPTTVSNLPAGPHLLRISKDGYAGEQRIVEVVAGDPARIEVKLKPSLFKDDLENARKIFERNFAAKANIEDTLRSLRTTLAVDELVVLQLGGARHATTLNGYVLRPDGRIEDVGTSIPKEGDFLARYGDFIGSILGGKPGPDPSEAALDPQKPVQSKVVKDIDDGGGIDTDIFKDKKKSQKSLTSQWWFWTAVAGGAALLGGGVYMLTRGTGAAAAGATGSVKLNLSGVKSEK